MVVVLSDGVGADAGSWGSDEGEGSWTHSSEDRNPLTGFTALDNIDAAWIRDSCGGDLVSRLFIVSAWSGPESGERCHEYTPCTCELTGRRRGIFITGELELTLPCSLAAVLLPFAPSDPP